MGSPWRRAVNWVRPRPSVCFYTFHRCASTLFADYLLRNIDGMTPIDYLSQIYHGHEPASLTFERRGHVYGPLRLTAGWAPALEPSRGLVASVERLRALVSTEEFVKDKTAMFLVRDPRDMLVSMYYSFGFSHGFSPVPEIRECQEQDRREIQGLTIDEFALTRVAHILAKFDEVERLSGACRRGVVLRYEDMIDKWDHFVDGLTRLLEIQPRVLKELYQRSRPREVEDVAAHRRSGRPGGFRAKLKPETIASLNVLLSRVLGRFRYDA